MYKTSCEKNNDLFYMYVICEIQSKNLKLFILVCNLFRHMYVYRMKLNTTYFKITQNANDSV